MADYTVKIVDQAGVVTRTLVNANVISIVEGVNEVGYCVFTFPKNDPASASGQAADVDLLEREIQVWRTGDTDPLFWGVMVDADASSDSAEVRVMAPGLGWYFSRRFVDRPRTNYITNPHFESGTTGWSTFGGATATVVATPRRLGTQAVRLTNASTGADAGLRTTFDITGLPGIGTNVYVAAHFLVETFTGHAYGELSTRLVAEDALGAEVGRSEKQLGDGDELASSDGWLREEHDIIHVTAGETWTFTLDLMAPNGSIVWDATQGVIPESLSDYDADVSDLMGQIVTDIQDATHKSDLNIDVSTPATGITIPVYALQYTDHTPADSAIEELANRDDGPDWYIATTSTTRTFTTVHPSMGSDISGTTTLSMSTNLAAYTLKASGQQTENHITYYGEGDGPDREEGYASDASLVGGLVLQGVYRASPEATIDMLEPLAEGQLAAKKRLARFLTCTTRPEMLYDSIGVGDQVAVSISDGWVNIAADWRVVRRERLPRTRQLVLTLVEV